MDPPEAAIIMAQAKMLNDWYGTAYTFEDVAAMDPLIFEIHAALYRALNPPKESNGNT